MKVHIRDLDMTGYFCLSHAFYRKQSRHWAWEWLMTRLGGWGARGQRTLNWEARTVEERELQPLGAGVGLRSGVFRGRREVS